MKEKNIVSASYQTSNNGKQTVVILLLLIVTGVLLYVAFIFFVKYQAYRNIAENLKIELQGENTECIVLHNDNIAYAPYNHYLK